ncbi:MAG TPA: DUF1289 domain-containing protein [Amaricoccus sp.]|uniref:DUF1289 domain-containing protein n=1 Tax=Amaricoccus sp. TaxID=1872485 RepID=UPI001E091639|nr:DUF1289 domain-containing protein [Amaricoccus sp.]MCC0068102.1 DUF1289 domain-containing protein [Rhodovulum sp.]HPG23207.1 DUF1289 domain-containing protein [Amaricoccus sp.]HRW16908.1 DUF1289 domain-containing protein [Amaricoccus sp.]
MSDEVWRREAVESPCIKVCVVHPEARLCMGCYRSIEEITGWGRMSPEARRAVMAELPGRAPLLAPARRGGRAARLARREGSGQG